MIFTCFESDFHSVRVVFTLFTLLKSNHFTLFTLREFDKSQPPQYPRHLGGYLKKQGHHKTSPLLTMTSCYILKQISTKANLLDSPNTWGGWGYHTNRTTTKLYFPPYNNVVLYFKTIFYKRQPPQFPQQLGANWLSHKPDYHKTPPPLLTMMSCYILKQTSAKVNLLNSPNKNPKISSLGDNCSPP